MKDEEWQRVKKRKDDARAEFTKARNRMIKNAEFWNNTKKFTSGEREWTTQRFPTGWRGVSAYVTGTECVFKAQVSYNGQHVIAGEFDNIEDAVRAHDLLSIELYGQRAHLNMPNGIYRGVKRAEFAKIADKAKIAAQTRMRLQSVAAAVPDVAPELVCAIS